MLIMSKPEEKSPPKKSAGTEEIDWSIFEQPVPDDWEVQRNATQDSEREIDWSAFEKEIENDSQ